MPTLLTWALDSAGLSADPDFLQHGGNELRDDELVVLAGSAAKPAARYPTLPCPGPCPRAHTGPLE